MNINVNDILFPRMRRDDYIRCRKRGMTDKQIAECYNKQLETVQSNAIRWGLREPKFKKRKRGVCHD